jgi:hypothetical protein
MGCCASRDALNNSNRRIIQSCIEELGLTKITCLDIKRLDAQLLSDEINSDCYELLAKGLNISAPFELFATKGTVKKFELKASFLLFSKDSFENKQLAFFELTSSEKRKILRFFEWKYQLLNERVQLDLMKRNKIDKQAGTAWIESSRIKAGLDIAVVSQQIFSDMSFISLCLNAFVF